MSDVTQGVTSGVTRDVTPLARARFLPAAGRRTLEAAVVNRCPWCKRPHLHRGVRLHGAVRRSSCLPHRQYVLAVSL